MSTGSEILYSLIKGQLDRDKGRGDQAVCLCDPDFDRYKCQVDPVFSPCTLHRPRCILESKPYMADSFSSKFALAIK